ncbi:MAG: carboxymuconolactone decarboxylase family protein [Legionellales bacterium]|nr:carboxymuconolactone decarboxylase family protein [Legionellales bacterium]
MTSKSYKEVTQDISIYLGKLRKEMPEVMNGFSALSQAATKEGVLNKKTKELIALALGIAARCDGCIGFHVKALVSMSVTREELLEVLAMATYMGGGPSLMYAADALRAYEEFTETTV